MATRDTTWTLHIETASGTQTITASGLEATTPTVTDGAEISTDLYFYPDTTGESPSARYQELWPFVDVAGEQVVRYGLSDTGVPWFRERIDDDAPVESLLAGVEPGPDTIDQRGWWGLLVGLEDASQPIESGSHAVRQYTADWVVLARFSEFADHTAVREAFATEVLG